MKRLVMITIWISLAIFTAGAIQADGDPAAGQAKSQICAACHGLDGNSLMPQNPVLAGQVPGYIAQQLAQFKSGVRKNAIMAGMTQLLSEQDMQDLDAWFSSQTAPPRTVSADDLELAHTGEKLYRGGDSEMSVPACMGCHGPAGLGIPPNYPRLTGQWSTYLEDQLLAFKDGQRASPIMGPIAFRLSVEQIKTLAVYMSALQ
ncbi:MAG: c-type cytochrome [Pseudomonadota bacterium]|nr:c-type cytochrome [Pseudomonadota bacterium]